MNIKIRAFFGNDIEEWVDHMAELRISEFKKYPYLYFGNKSIEKTYLSCYTREEHGLFLIAFDDDKVAGIASGIPLVKSSDVVPGALEIFRRNKIDPVRYYYFGEFIVRPEYRSKGVFSKLFFKECLLVKKLGYDKACGMTVDREDEHPQKPIHYRNPAVLWETFGFTKTNYSLIQQWPTILPDGRVEKLNHTLSFWIKKSL